MHKIREYKSQKGIMIYRDLNVVDEEQVYIGNGQGCGTFWFKNTGEARRFIDQFRKEIEVTDLGCVNLIPKEICLKCKGHYSFGTKEWKKAKERSCKEYKENLKSKVG